MTYVSVNIGNATRTAIVVTSSQTGKEFSIRPGHFKKVPHSNGNLLITIPPTGTFRLQNVEPLQVDEKYLVTRSCFFGPGWVTLNVMLETSLQLYVLTRNKEIAEEQPSGYPKSGERTGR